MTSSLTDGWIPPQVSAEDTAALRPTEMYGSSKKKKNTTACSVTLCRIQSANTEGGDGGSRLSGGLPGARSETEQFGVLPDLGHAQNNIWLKRA